MDATERKSTAAEKCYCCAIAAILGENYTARPNDVDAELDSYLNGHPPPLDSNPTDWWKNNKDTQEWLNWHGAIYVHPQPPFRLNEFFQLPD